MPSDHLHLHDGAVWPHPDRAAELEHVLRYGVPTREELLAIAVIVDAYRHIVTHPATRSTIEQVREARRIVRRSTRQERPHAD